MYSIIQQNVSEEDSSRASICIKILKYNTRFLFENVLYRMFYFRIFEHLKSEIGGHACPRLVRPMSMSAIFRKMHVRVRVRVHGFKNFHVRFRGLVNGILGEEGSTRTVLVEQFNQVICPNVFLIVLIIGERLQLPFICFFRGFDRCFYFL